MRKMSLTSPYGVSTLAYLQYLIWVTVDDTYLYASADQTFIYRELLSSCAGSSFTISTVYAGSSTAGFNDGSIATATFTAVVKMALDPTGIMYLIDGGRLRIIAGGIISTLLSDGFYDVSTGTYDSLNFDNHGFTVPSGNVTNMYLTDTNRILKLYCSTKFSNIGSTYSCGMCTLYLLLSILDMFL